MAAGNSKTTHRNEIVNSAGEVIFAAKFTSGQMRETSYSRDFSEFNFVGANLQGADFGHDNLSKCDFLDANLSRAFMAESNLSSACMIRANLVGANLKNANLERANLMGSYLNHANLNCADLRGADLTCADLRDANLLGANLSGADFRCAKLDGVHRIAMGRTFITLVYPRVFPIQSGRYCDDWITINRCIDGSGFASFGDLTMPNAEWLETTGEACCTKSQREFWVSYGPIIKSLILELNSKLLTILDESED